MGWAYKGLASWDRLWPRGGIPYAPLSLHLGTLGISSRYSADQKLRDKLLLVQLSQDICICSGSIKALGFAGLHDHLPYFPCRIPVPISSIVAALRLLCVHVFPSPIAFPVSVATLTVIRLMRASTA